MSLQAHFTTRVLAALLATALLPVATASANLQQDQEDAGDEESRPQVVTRVYSLRPLVSEARAAQGASLTIDVTALPSPVPAPEGALGNLNVSPQPHNIDATLVVSPEEVVSQVISIILETIEPETWRDNGGEPGSITYLPVNHRLVVTHTEQVQSRVGQLIHDLQDRDVVTIEARLVRLPDAQVEAQVQIVEGIAVWQGELELDVKPVAEVRFSGFEGRTHRAGDGKVVGYFGSVQPVVAANAVAYQPQVEEVNTGLELVITPVLSEDGSHVTLELSGEYALVIEPPAKMPEDKPGSGEPVLPDRLAVDRSAVQSALRIRVGQWVLVGTVGASRDGQPNEEAPLHLLLRVETGNSAAAPAPR